MRIANKSTYDMVKLHLSRIADELNKANKVIASGKRIIDLSDDPVGIVQALKIRASLSNIEQMGRNIALGKSWLEASESALSHAQDLVSDAKALCVQMATSTTGPDQRSAAAKTVQNLMKDLIALGNTMVDGRYIFAGSRTDTAPFSQDGTYNGDNYAFTIKIGQNATVKVGRDGQSMFQPSGGDIFQTLTDLKTDLENDNVRGIRNAMTRLDAFFDHITAEISDIGSKMVRMEIKEKILQDLKITSRDRLSIFEDADMAEAIIDLKSKETAYKAALASSARVMRLSLVDYL